MTCVRRISVRMTLALLLLAAPISARAGQLDQRLITLSNAGSGEAAYHLGMLYHMGLEGVAKNPCKAFEMFKLAADRGDPLGAYKVGCFYDGQGEGVVESNPELALKYKLVAAKAGYSLAQEDVARHYLAQENNVEGLRWLEAAAAQGNRMALLAVGSLYAGLVPPDAIAPKVPKDVVKGWAYLLLAARDVPQMRSGFEAEVAKLAADQQKRVREFVAKWEAKPTPLSKNEGIDAAYRLAGLPIPKN